MFGLYSTGLIISYLVFILANRDYLSIIPPFNPEPVLIVATFTFLGVLLTQRQPGHRIGWMFLSVALLRQIALIDDVSAIRLAQGAQPSFWLVFTLILSSWVSGLTFTLLALIIVLFPTGNLPSVRWKPALWLFGLQALLALGAIFFLVFDLGRFLTTRDPSSTNIILTSAAPGGLGTPLRHIREVPGTGLVMLLMGLIFLGVGFMALWSQFSQYRHGSQIVRQQIKWVLFAVSLWVLVFILVFIGLPAIDPILSGYLPLVFLVVLLVPFAIAIAILRYRLWDIDILIRRTAIYGTLTIILGLFYFATVTVLQSLVSNVSGERSPAVIVVSTLLIAMFFNPVRRRIQSFIDRRFYRRRYDTEQILAGFTLAVRDEVDLDELAQDLLDVVQESLQPETVSIWLSSERG